MKTIKEVTKGIYNRIETDVYINGVKQFKSQKIGEKKTSYILECVKPNIIKINGKSYFVENRSAFAIKITRNKIIANGGSEGLIKFLLKEKSDNYERKVLDIVRENK